jgi:hypothetical protein
MYAYSHILDPNRVQPRVAHTTSKAVTMTPFKYYAPIIKQPLDPRPIITHYKHLKTKNNSNNSKPMIILPQETIYHIIRYNLVFAVFYVHAFIISLFHYLIINYTFSQNRVHSNKNDISRDL